MGDSPPGEMQPDAEGRQYLDVQRHAAAVQLLGRDLAIAHLRAQLSMPRGCTVNLAAAGKRGAAAGTLPPGQRPAATLEDADAARPPMRFRVTATAADLRLQPGEAAVPAPPAAAKPPAAALRLRALVRRRPDELAARRFAADVPPEPAVEEQQQPADGAAADASAGPQQTPRLAPAPRIAADPAQAAHQLAGWVRVAAPGEAGAEEDAAGGLLAGEDVLGPGGGVPDGLGDDLMDEEEWV